jgi:uncharacterized membrane protein
MTKANSSKATKSSSRLHEIMRGRSEANMGKAGALVAAGIVASGVVIGPAVPASAGADDKTVRIYNQTNDIVELAIAGGAGQVAIFTSEGWYAIPNGEFRDFTGKFMRLQSPNGSTWPFPQTETSEFCVKSAAFTVYNPGSVPSCESAGGRMATFSAIPDFEGTYHHTMRYS